MAKDRKYHFLLLPGLKTQDSTVFDISNRNRNYLLWKFKFDIAKGSAQFLSFFEVSCLINAQSDTAYKRLAFDSMI